MISPTVGRKVWYRPNHLDLNVGTESTPPMQASGDQPLDATVVAVWGDRCVNLVIFDSIGSMFTRRSVALKQDDDAITDGVGYAEWMPYQAAQAKKHEVEATA